MPPFTYVSSGRYEVPFIFRCGHIGARASSPQGHGRSVGKRQCHRSQSRITWGTHMDWQELILQPVVLLLSTLGALLLSVIGNLITPFVKDLLAKLSTRVRDGQKKKKRSMGRAIETLRQDSALLLGWKITVLQHLLWAVLLQLLAISAILLGGHIAGVVATLLNIVLINRTAELFKVVYAAEGGENKYSKYLEEEKPSLSLKP